jgi:hypothetical protein
MATLFGFPFRFRGGDTLFFSEAGASHMGEATLTLKDNQVTVSLDNGEFMVVAIGRRGEQLTSPFSGFTVPVATYAGILNNCGV